MIEIQIQQAINEYMSKRYEEPTHIILHPLTHQQFINELLNIANQEVYRIANNLEYRGMKVVRSLDIKPGEILLV